MDKEKRGISVKWAAVTLVMLALVIGGSIAALSLWPRDKVTDFESCKAAGGVILETYPEQCRIHDASYTNEAQVPPEYPDLGGDGSDYVGLTEDSALAKAEKENISARVVERNGESLPVTMDFVYGRHNLFVKDGLVHKVEIEGEAVDSN